MLCRWAFCVSVNEPSRPAAQDMEYDGSCRGEITWETFSGEHGATYLCLLRQRCVEDGVELTPENLKSQLLLHVHRSLGYLLGGKRPLMIEDLLALSTSTNNVGA